MATCAKAMPALLAEEMGALGLNVTRRLDAGVETEGSLLDAMRMNLQLRTAHRILYLLAETVITNPDELYNWVRSVPWEQYVRPDGYVSVQSSVLHSSIRDTRFAALRCKDAIVDRIRDAMGQRPDSGPEDTGSVVFLFWRDEYAAIYVDTSGEPLSRRGYRRLPWKAPLRETLAAGIVISSAWDGQSPFVNPMCGSGTLAIEAALMATATAPGLLRKNFGFMHVPDFRRKDWEELRSDAIGKRRTCGCEIVASDHDQRAVKTAQANARAAGMGDSIRFETCDFARTTLPGSGGVVILNPEYGERLGKGKDLSGDYRAIGDFFKKQCRGRRGFVFTGNMALAKGIGLRSKRRVQFFNSTIECRLLEFDIYEGTKRVSRQGSAGQDVNERPAPRRAGPAQA